MLRAVKTSVSATNCMQTVASSTDLRVQLTLRLGLVDPRPLRFRGLRGRGVGLITGAPERQRARVREAGPLHGIEPAALGREAPRVVLAQRAPQRAVLVVTVGLRVGRAGLREAQRGQLDGRVGLGVRAVIEEARPLVGDLRSVSPCLRAVSAPRSAWCVMVYQARRRCAM